MTVSAIFTKLRNFLQTYVVPTGTEVVQGLGNRVSTPRGAYVAMTALLQVQMATNERTHDSDDEEDTIMQSRRIDVQLDFYGPLSGDWAAVAAILLRDPVGCAALTPACQPLYTTDARQIPTVTGEEQYQQRWSLTATLQFHPSATLDQQSADTLAADLIAADIEYTP